MIRRSPAEYYIRYLVSHPSKITPAEISTRLNREDLDPLSNTYIMDLRADTVVPVPFFPEDRSHTASQKFLMEHKIQGFWWRDTATEEAFMILNKPRSKEFVESMIIAGAPHKSIVAVLGDKFGTRVSQEGVARYQHYFWNVELVDTVELRAILEMRVNRLFQHPFNEVRQHAGTLANVKWNDPRYAAARLPQSPLTAIVTQMRIGILPTGIELVKLLQTTQVAATIRAMECSMGGGKGDAMNSMHYMNTAKMAGEMLRDLVKPEDELKKQINSLVLRNSTDRVPTIQEVSGGNHTADLLLEAQDPKEEEQDDSEPATPQPG